MKTIDVMNDKVSNKEILLYLKRIDNKVDKIETDVSSLKTDVSSLKTDVSSLKEGQKRIEQRTGKLVEIFFGVPEIKVYDYHFEFYDSNVLFLEGKKIIGEIDMLYFDKEKSAYLLVEVKSALNCKSISNYLTKIKRAGTLFQKNNDTKAIIYTAFATLKRTNESRFCNIEQKAKEKNFAVIMLNELNNKITILNKQIFK